MLKRLLIAACLYAVSQLDGRSAHAGDWPQILGPHRNGIAADEKISEKWAGNQPKKVWEAKVGSGFSGAAVLGNQVILFHREKAEDKLTAFNADNGKPIWSTGFSTAFRPQIVDDDGPRAVPTIQGDAVFAYSAEGRLYCVDLKTGAKRWEKKTHEEFGADGGYFGAGSAPLVDGNRVIVNVGGNKKGAGVVAFDIKSGDMVWTAVNDQASYAAPVIATVEGTRHLLCITRLNLVSLDPETGKERFRTPFGQRGPTVNGATPVVTGVHALLTASYGIGAEWIAISKSGVEVVWSDEILSSQYTTPIIAGDAIYGIDGRQDGGPIALKCFDPKTRKVHWSEPWSEYATLIAADGKLLVMQTDGKVKLVRMTPEKFELLASATLLNGKTRPLPALANGRLYVRNERTLASFDLSP